MKGFMTKLTSLALVAVMLLTTFLLASCNKNGEGPVEDESERRVTTLTIWLPTDETTTDAAVAAVEDAINTISKQKYKTQIDLRLVSDAEYDAAIDAQLVKAEEAKKAAEEEAKKKREEAQSLKAEGITAAAESTAPAGDETRIDENGYSEIVYPESTDDQIDIFLIRDKKTYDRYIQNEQISDLGEALSGDAGKVLRQYINPVYFWSAAQNYYGGTYAVPNNNPIGEYTYLLLNKELVDNYFYAANAITTPDNVKDFLLDVFRYDDVRSNYRALINDLYPTGVQYLGEDMFSSEFSLLSTMLTPDAASISELSEINAVYNYATFKSAIKAMRTLQDGGYVTYEEYPEEHDFAAAVIKGEPYIVADYEEDYYINVYEMPVVKDEDLYDSMFAVSSYTKDVNRAMEIIALINTDATVRNLLQYGIEDTNYTLNQDGTITRLNQDYMMNLNYTGNMYIAYPEEGMPANAWDYCKQTYAADTPITLSSFVGFADQLTEDNAAWYDDIEQASKTFYDTIMNCTLAEFDTAWDSAVAAASANESLQKMLDIKNEDSLAYLYSEYFYMLYPEKRPEEEPEDTTAPETDAEGNPVETPAETDENGDVVETPETTGNSGTEETTGPAPETTAPDAETAA